MGWDVNVHCDCNHIVRSLMFSCTSTHTSCYAAARSLALPHIRHATLHDLHLHFMLCGIQVCGTTLFQLCGTQVAKL